MDSGSDSENELVLVPNEAPSISADGKKRGKIQGKPLSSVQSTEIQIEEPQIVQAEASVAVFSQEAPKNVEWKEKRVMSNYLWQPEEDLLLEELVAKMERWTDIAKSIPNRSARQCRLRWSRLNLNLNPEIKNGPWTEEEDNLLVQLVEKHGMKWSDIAAEMQFRTAEQIRGRYTISLNPERKPGSTWSREEHKILLREQDRIGNRWVEISKMLDGRVSKQVGSHFFEAVLPRTQLFLESVGKTAYKELTEEEIEQLVTYLQVKRSNSTVSIHKKLNKEAVKNKAFNSARLTVEKVLIPGALVPPPSAEANRIKRGRNGLKPVTIASSSFSSSSSGAASSSDIPHTDASTGDGSGVAAVAGDVTAAGASSSSAHQLMAADADILDALNAGDSSDSEGEEEGEGGGEPRRKTSRKTAGRAGGEDDGDEGSGEGGAKRKRAKVIWTPEEDAVLKEMMGRKKAWTVISRAIQTKTPRQCRVRWTVVLNPDIKVGQWTPEEDEHLLRLMETYGHQWTDISLEMNRTAEQVRGRFNNNNRARTAREIELGL